MDVFERCCMYIYVNVECSTIHCSSDIQTCILSEGCKTELCICSFCHFCVLSRVSVMGHGLLTVQLSLIFNHSGYLTTSSLPVLRCGPAFLFPPVFFLSFHCGCSNIFFYLAQPPLPPLFFFAFLQKWACRDWTAAENHLWGFHTSDWSALTSCCNHMAWGHLPDFPCASTKSG